VKIVRIIARLNVGGPAQHVTWVTAAMRETGHDTVLVTGSVARGEADMKGFALSHGVRPVVIPEMSRELSVLDVITLAKLWRLLVRERPDVIHTHTAKAGAVGRAAAFLYRWMTPKAVIGRPRQCVIVHTYHGHVFHGYHGPLLTRLFLTIERILARVATDRIVVLSEQQRAEIHETFKIGRAAQFAIVPLGLDLSRFDRSRDVERRAQFREPLGVDQRCVLVGIVGRLVEIKNHELFLHGIAEMVAARGRTARPVLFIIIGDGHLRSKLEGMVRELGITEHVRFEGTREDPEVFLAGLDLVVLTSKNEGTPLVIIESFASRTPVLSTAVGGVGDLLGSPSPTWAPEEGTYKIVERGVLVRSGDRRALVAAMHDLADDEHLRDDLARRIGASAAELEPYSVERLRRDLETLYQDAMALSFPNASPVRAGNRKSILVITQVFVPDPASVGQHMADVTSELARRGHRVTVLTSDRGYADPRIRYSRKELQGGVSIRRLALTSFGKSSLFTRLAGAFSFFVQTLWFGLLARDVDSILVSTVPSTAALAGAIVGFLKGARLTYWVMDLNPDQAVALGVAAPNSAAVRLFDWMNRVVLKRAVAVVAMDRFMATRLLAKLDVSDRLHVVSPWAHEQYIKPTVAIGNRFREQHQFGDRFVVMYSGNHSLVNPLTTIIDAAVALQGDSRFVFVFIGDGAAKADVLRANATNIVHFPYQPLEALSTSLGAADVHVVTMGDDMSGIVHPSKVYGALAAGRPIVFVGPTQSPITELLAGTDVGWHFVHGDVSGLVAKLRELASLSPAERIAINQRAGGLLASRGLAKNAMCGAICDLVEAAPEVLPLDRRSNDALAGFY
jgi:glycosyltransferase involved in cell wall biosynthesis